MCHECDLALLRVDPESVAFLSDVPAAELGGSDFLPDLRDKVSVVGFPVGGDEVSITDGVVSRVEMQSYSHSARTLLAITVDAAVNSGNSGGPVFSDDIILGIAVQVLNDPQKSPFRFFFCLFVCLFVCLFSFFFFLPTLVPCYQTVSLLKALLSLTDQHYIQNAKYPPLPPFPFLPAGSWRNCAVPCHPALSRVLPPERAAKVPHDRHQVRGSGCLLGACRSELSR